MPIFEGIYPAIATPMFEDGALNEKAFRSVMEFNINAGVGGFWVAGGNGESVLLSDEENMKIAEIAVSQNNGRINNIMHNNRQSSIPCGACCKGRSRSHLLCPTLLLPPIGRSDCRTLSCGSRRG